MAAARAARLDEDVESDMGAILESLLTKGYSYDWILTKLDEKKESRDTYRSNPARILRHQGIDAGWQPGRRRYHKRAQPADIELFYYH